MTTMTGFCPNCHRSTADYIITPEMTYTLCDHCYHVEVIQLASKAA